MANREFARKTRRLVSFHSNAFGNAVCLLNCDASISHLVGLREENSRADGDDG